MKNEVLGIIPARGGSKSIPRKNLAPLAGRPLIAHTFEAAKASSRITRIIVSTDDAEIAAFAASQGVEVPFLRPPELATDQAPILPVLKHLLGELGSRENYRPVAVVLLQPTSPLRAPGRIDAAIDLLFASGSDSVVSVVEAPHQFNPLSVLRMEAGMLTPFLPGEGARIMRRQDKPRVFARNGPSILVSAVRTLLEKDSLYGERCAALEMPPEESIDIDAPFDLELAEFFLRKRAGSLPGNP